MTCEWIRHEDKGNGGILATRQIVMSFVAWGKKVEQENGMGKKLSRIGFRYDHFEVPVRDSSENII